MRGAKNGCAGLEVPGDDAMTIGASRLVPISGVEGLLGFRTFFGVTGGASAAGAAFSSSVSTSMGGGELGGPEEGGGFVHGDDAGGDDAVAASTGASAGSESRP